MSGKQGPADKQRCGASKLPSDKSDGSSPTHSPQRPARHRRRRRNRASSSSSDGIVLEAKRDMRHMENLLLHSGKLHVFRTYFGDPTIDFYTRPEGRRRHAAGARNRPPPPDENLAIAVLGEPEDNFEALGNNKPALERPLAAQVDDEGPPSVVSSRGMSTGSSVASFATFTHSPPERHADFDLVPFEGLPPNSEGPEEAAAAAAARPRPGPGFAASSSADHDDYMASVSASDSDEQPARLDLDPVRVADRLNRMVMTGNSPASLPEPEPMSLSSDPATPRESD